MNLSELTECNTGVVVFRDNMTGLKVNWSSIIGIPQMLDGDIVVHSDGDDLVEIDQEYADADADVYDLACKLAGEIEVPARFWQNDTVTIVTFFMWE